MCSEDEKNTQLYRLTRGEKSLSFAQVYVLENRLLDFRMRQRDKSRK